METARTTRDAIPTAPAARTGRGLHSALWVAQILLALAFGAAGIMHGVGPIPDVLPLPPALVRFIGLSEFAGALDMVLPAASRIKPGLTPSAAIGLTIVMGLAAIFHLTRGEFASLPVNFALGGLAAFVAWGRLRKAPIASR